MTAAEIGAFCAGLGVGGGIILMEDGKLDILVVAGRVAVTDPDNLMVLGASTAEIWMLLGNLGTGLIILEGV